MRVGNKPSFKQNVLCDVLNIKKNYLTKQSRKKICQLFQLWYCVWLHIQIK